MVDNRASLRCNSCHNYNVAYTLTKDVLRSLLVESRRIVDRAAKDIGTCLEPKLGNPDIQGSGDTTDTSRSEERRVRSISYYGH